jgi:hypothetical protein
MFSFGVIAVRYDWFDSMYKETKYIRNWFLTIIAAFAVVFLYFIIFLGVDADLSVFMGGFSIPALLFAIADNIICIGIIFVLIPLFYAKFNTQGPRQQNLSSSSFHMYLIHALILVPVSLIFTPMPLFPVVKFIIVFPVTVVLCYVISHYLLKKIL